MPDLDQIKQGEQGVGDRGGRFARGRSGNPAKDRARELCIPPGALGIDLGEQPCWG